jgi:hypothetical protein
MCDLSLFWLFGLPVAPNNLHHVCSKSKDWKVKNIEGLWNSKTKDLNRITNIDQGYLWLIRFLTNDHGYVPLVVSTFQSFPPHSLLFTGVVTYYSPRVASA